MATILFQTLADGTATSAPTGGAAPTSPFGGIMVPMMVIMAIWVFFSFNSKRKQDKQRALLLNSMKRGDRVQTTGGVLGTIVEVRDNEIVVKVDESNNTKIKFVRGAIQRVIGEEEKAEAKT